MVAAATLMRARAIAEQRDDRPARARVRSRTGRWLVCPASCLRDADGRIGNTALVIERATAVEIAPIVTQAYDLSTREQQIAEVMFRGVRTADMADRLFLSTHTVSDYIKAIFEKVGVSSRGELVAKLFAEQVAGPVSVAHPAIGGDGPRGSPTPAVWSIRASPRTIGRMLSKEQMDALVDGHYRAEEAGDIEAIVDGLIGGAEHDVAGRPGGPLHADEQIAAYYRDLLARLRVERSSPCDAGTGRRTSSLSRSCAGRRCAACSASTAAAGPSGCGCYTSSSSTAD